MSERAAIGFIGLGMMGLPMAARLVSAGYRVCGYDLSKAQGEALAAQGGEVAMSPRDAAAGARMLVTMLPNAEVVADALFGQAGAASGLAKGTLVIDMSSSAPLKTQALGDRLKAAGIGLIDAPVSGGVARAANGSLAIMAGGNAAEIELARPLLESMGSKIFLTGPLGSGHAMKALNNYVSASGLVAACEALVVGKAFGLEPGIVVDVLNASTGRNNSTETKLKPFVLSETFASGFAAGLMAKDIRTAADLAGSLEVEAPEIAAAAELWETAAQALGKGADHTGIYRFLADRARHGKGVSGGDVPTLGHQ